MIWTFTMSAAAALALFVVLAYFVLPFFWKHFEHEPQLDGLPMRTQTSAHIPGDPFNLGLAGSEDAVRAAFARIGWLASDPLGFRDDLKIAGSVLLHESYDRAPVSNLYYQGRVQDLAFELPVGASARQRHHFRLWKVLDKGSNGQPLWLGAASFDKGVGISHYTGQITHHIDADLDKERDGLIRQLTGAGLVTRLFQVSGIGPTLNGRNGEGDRFFTDGEVTIAELAPAGIDVPYPKMLDNPPLVRLKQTVWEAFAER